VAFNDDEDDSQCIQADCMVDRAQEMVRQGKLKTGLATFTKALQIYVETGKYMKIDEAIDEMLKNHLAETDLLQLIYTIQDIIGQIEYLGVPEEVGLLKYRLANIYFNAENYQDAAQAYQDAAELLFAELPDEYRNLSATLLIRAAECNEKIKRSERAEKLLLTAITRFNLTTFNFTETEKEFQALIAKKKYPQAIEKLREIGTFFRQLQKILSEMEDASESVKNLENNVQARLYHMLSEYNLLKMICFRYAGNEDAVRNQAEISIHDLGNAIMLMKEEIKTGLYTKADLQRLTYDVFLLQIFQEYADTQIEDPLDLASRGLPPEALQEVTEMFFYRMTVHLLKVELKGDIEWLEDIDMGSHLNAYKQFMLNSLKIAH
jgi:tetratricopeptide (TPR) repeat protein